MELKEALKRAIGHEDLLRQFALVDATIKSVDWDNRLCTVNTDEYGEIDNVRLRGAGDNNTFGLVSKPTVNSLVVIGLLYNQPGNAVIVSFTAIDMLSLCDASGNEVLNVDLTSNPAKIVWNGGLNGATVIIQNLVNKLNRLENVMTTHQHTAPNGPTVSDGSQTIAPATTVSDLADNNFKH